MFAVTGLDGQIFRGSLEDLLKVPNLPTLRETRRIGHAPDEAAASLVPPGSTDRAQAAAAAAYGKAIKPVAERGPVYRASQLMSEHVVTLLVDAGVERAWRTLVEHKVGQAPVVDARRRLVGLLSRERLLHVLNEEDGNLRDVLSRTVTDVMQTPVVAAGPDAEVRRITRVMLDYQLPAVPIIDEDGRLTGIVSRTDVLRVVVTDPPLTLWA